LQNRSAQLDEKVALITGVTGQGGAYLAGFILQKSYILHCVKHRSFLFKMARIDRLIETSVLMLEGLQNLVGNILWA
jgi:GDP-D-mannose dehydratase